MCAGKRSQREDNWARSETLAGLLSRSASNRCESGGSASKSNLSSQNQRNRDNHSSWENSDDSTTDSACKSEELWIVAADVHY